MAPWLIREIAIKNTRILAAALLSGIALAAQAHAADGMAPTRWRLGVQLGTVQDRSNTEPTVQASLGYDIDRTWSVEALANLSMVILRDGGLQPGDREFDHAFGARVLAALPLGDRWRLVGGLGVVQFEDETGAATFGDNLHHTQASPMLSLAAMVRLGRRWSLGAEASSFTEAHTFNAGLRAEFHF